METTKERRPQARPERRPGSVGARTASRRPRAGQRPGAARKVSTPTRKPAAGARPAPKRTAAPAPRRNPRTVKARRSPRPNGTPMPRRRENNAPQVVYTPPKPFSRSRLLLQLTTVVAVVLALSLGLSIFFKVEVVTVSGTKKYDPWTIKEASGIEIGDQLLSFGEAKAAGKIKAALPYVDTVRIGIKLPDTVNIEIKEFDVVYAIRDAAEQWWLITAEGRVVEQTDSAVAGESAQILGVKLANPVPGQQAVAQEMPTVEAPVSTEGTDGTTEATVQTVLASDRLSTALTILQHMENNGILGGVASVNVTDLAALEIWYGQRFQVKLGDMSQMERKIQWMNAAINGGGENSLKEYDSGILDITFTIKEDQVIYQVFPN